MTLSRKECFDHARRVVVKVGSNVITGDVGLNLYALRHISRQVCNVMDTGRQVMLVSSGALACGLKKMGHTSRPEETEKRQALSAVGQAGLIMEYEAAFDRYGFKVAQVLLTSDGFTNRSRYLNARNTIETLLSWQVVPIINENDTVAVEHIKFEDNDTLAALIAMLMDADFLVSLTDIDGLYTSDPRTDKNARLLSEVDRITEELENMAGSSAGPLGRGGMTSKIKAARTVTAAGIPMVIANGTRENSLTDMFSGQNCGTFFVPGEEKLASRKCWIGYSVKPLGLIRVDKGAAEALLYKGKSLLPSGITGVEGSFDAGSPVEVAHEEQTLGMGLVNYDSRQVAVIMGHRSDRIRSLLGDRPSDVVIHRDNLVLTLRK